MAKQNSPSGASNTETPRLKEALCHCLQHALKDLDRAYQNFFAKRANFLQFKRRGGRVSFRYPDSAQIKLDQVNSRIFLPKLGWIRFCKSREIVGDLRNVTVFQSGYKWFISIQTQREVERVVSTATTSIGIDVGITRFATMSDGSSICSRWLRAFVQFSRMNTWTWTNGRQFYELYVKNLIKII